MSGKLIDCKKTVDRFVGFYQEKHNARRGTKESDNI